MSAEYRLFVNRKNNKKPQIPCQRQEKVIYIISDIGWRFNSSACFHFLEPKMLKRTLLGHESGRSSLIILSEDLKILMALLLQTQSPIAEHAGSPAKIKIAN